jgi:hypothetical protein
MDEITKQKLPGFGDVQKRVMRALAVIVSELPE